MLHLPDDLKLYGPLENCSAFVLENYFQKPNKPLEQIILRYQKQEQILLNNTLNINNLNNIKLLNHTVKGHYYITCKSIHSTTNDDNTYIL